MVSSHLEKIFLHYILSKTHYMDVTHERFFDDHVIKKVFSAAKKFYEKYHKTPSLAQMHELVRIQALDITAQQIDTLWALNLNEYDEDWLRDNAETFIEYKNLDISAIDMVNYLKTTPVTNENIKEIINEAKKIITTRNNINFAFDLGSDFFNAEAHIQQTYNTFKTGYEFINMVSDGGFSAGTLVVFVGQPKVGKSLWLSNLAAEAVKNGHNTAIITLEMNESKYIKRLGANLLGINVREYKQKANDREFIKSRINGLSSGMDSLQIPGKLFVKSFPTSTAAMPDIENYLLRVEEKMNIKFKCVFIDYLNIMKNWRNANTENTYMKIKQIAEDVRAAGQANNWAMISATQTKQSAFDESDMVMNAVSESSGLVATVDLMYAIIQTPSMLNDKVYKLKVLANRDEGYKNFNKMFDVDYKYMKITENSQPPYDGDMGHKMKPKQQ